MRICVRIRALTIRIIQQFIRDKRTLALLFLAPLLILSLMKLVFDGQSVVPELGIVDIPAALSDKIEQLDAHITMFDSSNQAAFALRNGDLDAVLQFSDSKSSLILEGSDPSVNRTILLLIQSVLEPSSGRQMMC